MDDHEWVPLLPAKHHERSPRRSDVGDADAAALTREQDIALAAFHQWRRFVHAKKAALAAYRHWHRLTDARLHDVDTLHALLPSIGEPVQEIADFWNYFATGRVMVQAHIKRNRPPPLRRNGDAVARYEGPGHASFYFENERYELVMRPDCEVKHTLYKAMYPTYRYHRIFGATPDERAVIQVRTPSEDITGMMQHMIKLGHLFVLNQRYSKHFVHAFEQERTSFMERPQSYGLRYNCQRFVLEVLKRTVDLSH
jgi:hypothetical protein